MIYKKLAGIHVAEVPASEFKVVMVDKKKKSAHAGDYCNAGFFGAYKEGKTYFTLPVAHLVCDMNCSIEPTVRYCSQRGKLTGDKLVMDMSKWRYGNPFYGKDITTLVIKDGKPYIEEMSGLPECEYAISGIPIIRNKKGVDYKKDVVPQGWDSSPLYGTWHVFAGVKPNDTKIYMMGAKTKKSNMITAHEMDSVFVSMGFSDVLKLDGGGSFYFKANGAVKQSTLENRQINTIITFDTPKNTAEKNPYAAPNRTLVKGKKGADVRWLQWELCDRGFPCDIDGSFGPGTQKALKAFQKSVGLAADGSCGPATRKALGV